MSRHLPKNLLAPETCRDMSRHLPKCWGCARDVGEEPSKWTHFGLKRGIATDDFLRILGAFLVDFGEKQSFFRFGEDVLTPETRSDPSVITK